MSDEPRGSLLMRNNFGRGFYHNYVIGGNECGAFALGAIESDDDFYLIGSEPGVETQSYPVLTGTILDSDGKLLFRLVRNVLTINPGHCSKIESDRIGYKIVDGNGVSVLEVTTVYMAGPDVEHEGFVTTLAGVFHAKNGSVALVASQGAAEERIEANTKCAFGSGGGIGMNMGYSQREARLIQVSWQTGGRIYEILEGTLSGETVLLDGKMVDGAVLDHCRIIVRTGDFAFARRPSFIECEFGFEGSASNVFGLAQALLGHGDDAAPPQSEPSSVN